MTPDLPPPVPEAPPPVVIVAPATEAVSIFVDSHGYRYTVSNNRRLPRATVVAVIEAAPGPQQALDALRGAYIDAGYFLVALRGEVSNKLVAIEVINGRISELDVTPPELTPYFTRLVDREDLNRNTMIRSAALAEIYSSRQGMRPQARFAPAKDPGGTVLTVTEEPIDGASRWNAGLGFNNLGSRYSSRYLAQGSVALRPGNGLELTAAYGQGLPGLTSDSAGGAYRSGTLGGSLVTPWGLFAFSTGSTDYTIGDTSAPLYPQGQIYITSVTGTQLVFANTTARWTINEGYTHTDNDVQVFEGSFVVTDQHYDFVTLGTSFNDSFAVFGLNASASAGLSVSKGLSAPQGSFLPVADGVASTRFTQVQASAGYVQSLPEGYSLTVNWTGQWSDATLPQNQQWVLGGFGNLSAWLPAVMVGDNGSLLRAAVSTPSWQWQGASVAATAFFEWGVVGLHYTPQGATTTRAASDAGLSISANYRTGTSAILAYAWPVASSNVEISTLNRQGRANLYFSLNQSF